MYTQDLDFKKILEKSKKHTSGKLSRNIRSTDNMVMIADSFVGLQRLLDNTTKQGDTLVLRLITIKQKSLSQS